MAATAASTPEPTDLALADSAGLGRGDFFWILAFDGVKSLSSVPASGGDPAARCERERFFGVDVIIERYVELEQSMETIVAETAIDAATVQQFCRMIDRAEYKRNQAAIVLKVTQRCFGRGRAMPIVMRG